MNWTNYDRLVSDLKATPDDDATTFNYWDPRACLACRCLAVAGKVSKPAGSSPEDIQEFLNVTWLEAAELYGGEVNSSYSIIPIETGESRGRAGITEALRRLAVVAARYERPAEPQPSTPKPSDAQIAAFLASCRDLIPTRQES